MNILSIWHELAEKALSGRYVEYTNQVSADFKKYGFAQAYGPYKFWLRDDFDREVGLFYSGTPEEQCLFLLFCGERYEGN